MIIKKINRLLTNKQRAAFLLLITALSISALLELLGIYFITRIVDTFDKRLAITAVLFYIAKNAFQLIICRAQYAYIYKCQLNLSRQLISGYLDKPYIFHTKTNSAEILRNIVIDSERFYQLVLNILMLFSEVMVAVLLGVFLLVTDLITTVFVIITLSILLFLYFSIVKNNMKKFGVLNHDSDANMHKAIKEALGAVKDIKITHRENYFVNQFMENGRIKTNAQIGSNILNLLPKYLFEIVCVILILAIVMLKLYQGENIASMLPELTAFVIAVFKLLPSVTKINNYVNQIVFLKPSLDLVYNDLKEMGSEAAQGLSESDSESANHGNIIKMPPAFTVRFENVTYKYPGGKKAVLNGVNLEIPIGKSIGIIGPTGAGKSTLADILLGILVPDEGRVFYGTVNVHENSRAWAERLSYIPQAIFLSDDTIRRNIAFGISDDDIDDEKVMAAAREAQLEDFIVSLPNGLDTEVGEMGSRLSGGQRQRIGIARALYTDPEIIVLDEATSSLDNDTELAIMEAINRLHGKKTLVIIAHRLTTIENCDLVYKVENGRVEKA